MQHPKKNNLFGKDRRVRLVFGFRRLDDDFSITRGLSTVLNVFPGDREIPWGSESFYPRMLWKRGTCALQPLGSQVREMLSAGNEGGRAVVGTGEEKVLGWAHKAKIIDRTTGKQNKTPLKGELCDSSFLVAWL